MKSAIINLFIEIYSFINFFFLVGKRRKGKEIRESWYCNDVVQPAYFQ